MSEDMPSSWRYFTSASSRLSSLKEYVNSSPPKHSVRWQGGAPPRPLEPPEDERKSWRAWAGHKMRLKKGQSDGAARSGAETLNLFPGWAVRRYRKIGSNELDEAFEVEVFISGFAISHRSLENASRSQRAFIRLAKGFASLPKITADVIEPPPPPPPLNLTPSTEALLAQKKLPPRPTEITEDYVVDALERHLQRANEESPSSTNSSRSSSIDSDEHNPPSDVPETRARNPATAIPADALRKLHANLETRLQPFWSSVLASRTVRLHLFASPHHYLAASDPSRSLTMDDRDAVGYGPVGEQEVVTAADGSFQARFTVKWEELCQHPGALHIAFGDRLEEHDLLIAAELLPPSPSPSSSSSDLGTFQQQQQRQQQQQIPVSPPKTLHISITHSPLRVISDIDDTVKLSNVISGARAVFQSVFVKDLQENVIPGMGEWYTRMWSEGIRFHYVSNSPFELLPVISEFFQISQLPPGSIRLKSYAGRSIFNGILSAPAMRKRAGVVDILDAFPESRFILIGDTGEQDLELYSELARERPAQILAVFVRDVETGEPIDDPTGWNSIGASATRSNTWGFNRAMDDTPRPRRTLSNLLSGKNTPSTTPKVLTPSPGPSGIATSSGEYFTTAPLTAEPEPFSNPTPKSAPASVHNSAVPNGPPPPPVSGLQFNPARPEAIRSPSISSSLIARMPEAEKRRYNLQSRVCLARTQMPSSVPLRIFRDPNECVEVEDLLNKRKQE